MLLARSFLPRGSLLPRLFAPFSTAAAKVVLKPLEAKDPAELFCFQCEQTVQGKGCTSFSNCGKSPEVARLQDMLIYTIKGISMYAARARALGQQSEDLDRFVMDGIFSTITNVNFSADRMKGFIEKALEYRDVAKGMYESGCSAKGKEPEKLSGPATFVPKNLSDVSAAAEEAGALGIQGRQFVFGKDVVALQELITYGVKGLVAYAHHAHVLGEKDPGLMGFVHDVLDYLTTDKAVSMSDLYGKALEAGKWSLKSMELLEKGHIKTFGKPSPTKVAVTPRPGKAILVSGHDLIDLRAILEQTKGTGINVYTHGEMLPAHGYPGLREYSHLAGNYGGAWQNQKNEFAAFPGPIVMTTNCVLEPRDSYRARVFTRGVVGVDKCPHLPTNDYAEVIKVAQSMGGFTDVPATPQEITVGFGKDFILSVADAVVAAVKEGKISKFYVIGGCDGAEGGRNYFTKLATSLPESAVILTLGCGKYRFNKLDFGTVPGTQLPRLLDMGQCNDAYGAIQVAVALSKVFNCGVNDLPIGYAVSWFEQKAVAVLLALLHLGVKNIHLGPKIPAFATPSIVGTLNKLFNLKGVSTPEKDFDVKVAE